MAMATHSNDEHRENYLKKATFIQKIKSPSHVLRPNRNLKIDSEHGVRNSQLEKVKCIPSKKNHTTKFELSAPTCEIKIQGLSMCDGRGNKTTKKIKETYTA